MIILDSELIKTIAVRNVCAEFKKKIDGDDKSANSSFVKRLLKRVLGIRTGAHFMVPSQNLTMMAIYELVLLVSLVVVQDIYDIEFIIA